MAKARTAKGKAAPKYVTVSVRNERLLRFLVDVSATPAVRTRFAENNVVGATKAQSDAREALFEEFALHESDRSFLRAENRIGLVSNLQKNTQTATDPTDNWPIVAVKPAAKKHGKRKK